VDGGYSAGGSGELAELIDEFGELLLPDLKHYYGIDLRDLFAEANPLSPRFVLVHIKHLPIGSAFVAENRGGQQFRGWDEAQYMTAGLINAVRSLQYVTVLANSDPNKRKPGPPDPYPTPDEGVRRKYRRKSDHPGSFGFMAKARLAGVRKLKEQHGR
jgi:hypothetical protein